MKTFTYTPSRSFAIFLFICCSAWLGGSTSLYAQSPLNGTFTLGGTSPDFATLTEAIDSLNSVGVSGPVVFDMRSGTYQEQLVLTSVAGASAANPITFRSESGDSSDVTITWFADQVDNYTIKMDSASWFNFERLTFQGTNTSYGRVIELKGGSSHNRFSHNFFDGVNTSSSSSLRTTIYSTGDLAGGTLESYNQFDQNHFYNGSYALYFQGNGINPGELEVGNTFEDNIFESYYYRGLFLSTQDSLKVNRNTFDNVSGSSSQRAIYLTNGFQFEILHNTFQLEKAYGMYINNCVGDSLAHSVIANNTLSMGGTSTFGYGLYVSQCNYVDYYHNTFNLYGIGPTNYPFFYANKGLGERFLNNIFAYTGTGTGRAYYSSSVVFPDSMDHNDFYTSSPVLAYLGVDISDLTAFRNATGKDANSVSGNPLFTSSTDFHVNKAALNAAGAQGTGIALDFEGDVRGVVPDIGADEFTPTGIDVAMTYFEYPTPPFGAGNYTMKAGFTNLTSTPLVSAQVYLEINGTVEPVYNWSGSLAQGQSDTLSLGSFAFANNQAYNLRAWITNPNLTTDIDPTDDSVFVQQISTALAGTYTIGGTSPDFMTFTDAISNLNGGGVADTVRFMVRSGTYTEQIIINEFVGGGCNGFPVYFKSESGDSTDVTLTYSANSSANYTLFLNGADHLIFENIGFTYLSTSYSRVVELSQGADCNQFLNCLFVGRDVNSSSNRYAVIYSSGSTPLDIENMNVFRNNRIEEGSYGIYWLGYSGLETRNIFEHNTMLGQRATAMYITNQMALKVSHNHITLDSVYSYARGLQLSSGSDSFSVDNNYVFVPNGGTGIILSNFIGKLNRRGKLFNNTITVRGDGNATGIDLSYSDTVDIVFNNVLIANDPTYESEALEDEGSENNDVNIFNNNFVNASSGYAVSRASGSTSDYNNYYSKGSFLASNNYTDVLNLAAYQLATGQDAHSLSTDPRYLSELDLHVRKGALDSAGVSITGITKDIDDEMRSTPPDIGADEFSPLGLDAALVSILTPQPIFNAGSYPVKVVLKNSGALSIDSAVVNWSLNGTPQTPIAWYGSLAGRQTDTIMLGNLLFTDGIFTDIEAWVKQPNGIVDQDASDDTTAVYGVIPSLAGNYTVGGSNYDFLNFTQAFLALQNGGISDTVNFMVRTGTYPEQVGLQDYPGNSCMRPVTFQSETGNVADVVLTFAGTDYTTAHTVSLNHVNGMLFKNITFEGTDLDYARVVTFEGGCQCLTFEDNIFRATPGTSTSSSRALLSGFTPFGMLDSAIRIQRNQFRDGAFGLYYSGNGQPELTKDILIQDNVVSGQPGGGIQIYSLNHVSILNNDISSSSSSYSYSGISIGSLYEGLEVRKNRIGRTEGGYGLYLEYVHITNGPYALISNNFISLRGGDENYGIYAYDVDSLHIFHNSVWVKKQDPQFTYAFYGDRLVEVFLKNNLLINTGGGYANYIDTGLPPIADFNDLYSNGTNLGHLNGAITSLASWITASGGDSNSVSIDPVFSTFGDLHLSAGIMDNLGTPLPQVPDDIDGDARSLVNPDLGADEFSPSANDVGLLRTTSPVRTFAAGNQDIKVVLFNNGTNALSSATIDVRVDSISLAPTAWTGNLASGDSLEVTVGTFNFEIGNPYLVKAWASLPNGNADQFAANDTVRRDSLYPSLAGYYTVGGSNPDFIDIDEAIQVLTLSGVADEVFFNIRPDTIDGQWEIGEIIGASDSTRITFQAESGDSTDVVLTYNATSSAENHIMTLDGAGFITFKHLTFIPQSTNYPRLMFFENAAHDIHVENSVFLNFARNTSSNSYASVVANSSLINNLKFTNNYFENGPYGIYMSSSQAVGLEVMNNTFSGHSYGAVYVANQEAPIISNNDFSSTVSYIFRGIYLYNCTGQYRITQNQIRGTFGDYGIHLSSCQAIQGLPAEVSNNYIQMISTNSTRVYGLYVSNCSNIYFAYNTVRVRTTSTSNRVVYMTNSSGIELTNNIFANMNRGYGLDLSNSTLIASNHNNIYAAVDNVGYFNNVQNTLTDWQTATGQDANSLSVDPLFLTDSTFTIRETSLNGGATPLAGITVDIEGELRDATNPDIGADEFEPIFANDAGIIAITTPEAPFAAGNQDITVVLRNNGIDPLTSATVSWQINGINQSNYNWTGTLPASQTDTFVLANDNFMAGQGYDLMAWTSNPNGVTDTLTSNDTTKVFDLYPALSGVYTVGGVNPDFTSLEPVIEALNKGGILANVSLDMRAGTYVQGFNLGPILGTGPTAGVTFKSEGGDSSLVILKAISGRTVITLDGAAYVDFYQLTIEAPQVNWAKVFYITGGASEISIQNCHLKGYTPAQNFLGHPVIQGSAPTFAQLSSGIQIENNLIADGVTGIQLLGYSSSYLEESLSIINNQFEGQTEYGIHVEHKDAPIIIGNTIQTSNNTTTFHAIHVEDCYNDYKIQQNSIMGLENAVGLYLAWYRGTNPPQAEVFNNFIQIGGSDIAYGIQTYYTSEIDFYHNTIHITSTHPNDSRVWTDVGGSSFNFQNNNLVNAGGGYVYFTNKTNSIQTSSHNNLMTTGSTLISRASVNYADLVNWRVSTGKDLLSVSVDPFFQMIGEPDVSNAILDSAGIAIPAITTDIYDNTRNGVFPDIGAVEFLLQLADVGAVSLVNPVDGCGLSATEAIAIRIANFGSQSQSDFAVAYQIDGGAVVVDTVRASIAPGATTDFTFAQTADLSVLRTYQLRAWAELTTDIDPSNDSMLTVSLVHIPNLSQPVGNMLPADGTTGLDRPLTFSWSPAAGASTYDVFVWADSLAQPATPKFADVSQITVLDNTGLDYGIAYSWQIIAKNGCSTVAGPIQQFTMRTLPDLVVDAVSVPPTAFSGQNVNLSWTIKNEGTYTTGATQWTDAVYLSDDAAFDILSDTYLGGVGNFSSLTPGQSYVQNASFPLPVGIAGNYYLFVLTSAYSGVTESDDTNNVGSHITAIMVSLTPPPDLQVTAVVAPLTAFSGQPINLNYTVTNKGTGITRNGSWEDWVYLSEDPVLNQTTATLLGKRNQALVLEVDSNYVESGVFSIPQGIFGTYYIHVLTDVLNEEFEFVFESNNTAASDTIGIFLTPPPDLVTSRIEMVPDVNSPSIYNLRYTLNNQGGSQIITSWEDQIYLSADNVFDAGVDRSLLIKPITTPLSPGDSLLVSVTLNIPSRFTGPYYLFVQTDRRDQVYEYSFENNNVTISNQFNIINPDLVAANVTHPDTATTGDIIMLSWSAKNLGPGGLLNGRWNDQISLSLYPVYDPDSVLEIADVFSSASLSPGDSTSRSISVMVPNGLSGDYYVYANADKKDDIFEAGQENNNVARSPNPIHINLAPWPDLIVRNIQLPDTIRAGDTLPMSFTIVNQGTASTFGSGFTTKAYFQVDSAWNPIQAKEIASEDYSRVLEPGDSIQYTVDVSMPMLSLVVAGLDSFTVSPVFIEVDVKDEIYEYTDEANNRSRSDSFYIFCPPPVDLVVTQADFPHTNLNSGDPASVSWSVQNISSTTAYWNYPFWYDGIFLSRDTVWDGFNDVFVTDWVRPGPLEMNGSYQLSQTFNLLNGLSGAYYVFMVADHTNLNRDGNPDNNAWLMRDNMGQPQVLNVNLSPYPDLQPSLFSAPQNGTAGQPIQVVWAVENRGVGPTLQNSWTDQVYLSTDFVIDPTDVLLGTKIHTGVLGLNQAYNDTMLVALPTVNSGNYILLFKTDVNDVLYEHQGEQNNEAFAFIVVYRPPPSDLIVQQIAIPDSVIAGDTTTIRWTLKM